MRDQATIQSEVFTCSIPDMECADCAARVEKAIRGQDGILDLSLSVIGQKATVYFDPSIVDASRISSVVTDAGYTVRVEDEANSKEEAGVDWEKARTSISGVFFIAGLGGRFGRPEYGQDALWQGMLGLADVLLIGAALVGGFNFFPQGFRALRSLSLDMNFLMTAAIFGAVAIGEYVEAAAIAFLFSTAELLEAYAIDRARNSLRALMELAPEVAVVRRDGRELSVPAQEVAVDEVVIVRPGEKVPVDGEAIEGASSLDQAPITGESMPVVKEVGDAVFAGTINQEGYLEIRTTQVAANTTLGRIVQMVEQAEERRAPSEQFVRRFARYYTPAITLVALALMIVPTWFFGEPFDIWFVRGLTLLVIACPCALVISTPVAVVSGITHAARNGVLIKGGNYLEALAEIRVVAFDKTGTLTQGAPKVTDIVAVNGFERQEVLRVAASIEQRSKHPIARAIVDAAEDETLAEVDSFESIVGKGVEARIEGKMYRVGRPVLFAEEVGDVVERLTEQGKTAVVVGSATQVMGVLAVADTVRERAPNVVQALQERGIRVVMLTGDNKATGQAIAEDLGLDEWHAELLPEEKVEIIETLSRQYGAVAMVGDGVNDAPALSVASVGIAMGAIGSDVALETADVALMGDDLTKLPYLLRLSQDARRVIRQNVWLSIIVKFVLALGVFPGVVKLAVAVLVGDMGMSLAVTGNALRLGRARVK
jgi:Cd2+/Zn2+-exporting ATPase